MGLLPTLWRLRHSAQLQLLAAWLIPAWLVFEAVPTKLPHYVLPLYPALALAVVLALQYGFRAKGKLLLAENSLDTDLVQQADTPSPSPIKWQAFMLWLLPVVVALPIAAIFVLQLWANAQLHQGQTTLFLQPQIYGLPMLLVISVWLGYQARFCMLQHAIANAVCSAFMAALCLVVAVYAVGTSGEAMALFRLSPRLAEAVKSVASQFPTCHSFMVTSVDDHEPSLVFLLGTDLRLDNAADAASFMAEDAEPITRQSLQKPCRLALLGEAGRTAAVRAGLDLSALINAGHVVGLNINTGKVLDIGLYLRLNRPL